VPPHCRPHRRRSARWQGRPSNTSVPPLGAHKGPVYQPDRLAVVLGGGASSPHNSFLAGDIQSNSQRSSDRGWHHLLPAKPMGCRDNPAGLTLYSVNPARPARNRSTPPCSRAVDPARGEMSITVPSALPIRPRPLMS